VLIGVWAAFFPQGFYDDFPGFGRTWIAPDGPFNEHLIRDVGELNLALAIVTIAAAVALTPAFVRAVLAAWIVEGVLHVVYHSRHVHVFATSDKVMIVGSLVLTPVLAAGLLIYDRLTLRAT
jgi:hypothetical protein